MSEHFEEAAAWYFVLGGLDQPSSISMWHSSTYKPACHVDCGGHC